MQRTRSKRRQTMDYLSPAASSNRKRLDPFFHPHRLPANYCWSVEEETEEDPNSSRASGSGYSLAKKSSDRLLMAAFIGAGERHRGSSFGSCPTWNTFDKCPTTPSPVCSSLSCGSGPLQLPSTDDEPSFATPNQSSSVISNNGAQKVEASPEETQQESRNVSNHSGTKKEYMRGSDHGSSHKKCGGGTTPKPELKAETRYFRPVRRNSLYETDDDEGDDGGRLLRVSGEEQDDDRGCNQSCCLAMSASNVSSESDVVDGGMNGYGNSDIESYIEEHMASTVQQGRVRGSVANFTAETRRKKQEEKLAAWKQVRMANIMDKMRRKEAAIDEWEKKKTTKAKNDMKRTGVKLERKWSRGLNKMQRRLRSAHEEAEKRKAKLRADTAKKIAKVAQVFKKMAVTGKLRPCCFLLV